MNTSTHTSQILSRALGTLLVLAMPLWVGAQSLPDIDLTKPRDSQLQVQVSMTGHQLDMVVQHPRADYVMLELYNAAGVRVYEQMLPLSPNTPEKITLRLSHLDDGKILLRCSSAEKFRPTDMVFTKRGNEISQR